jgi:hypothetical protein
MWSVQFQTGNTDNRIIGVVSTRQGIDAQSGAFVHGKFTNDLRSYPSLYSKESERCEYPNGNMRSVEALCRLSSSGIIAGGGSRNNNFFKS